MVLQFWIDEHSKKKSCTISNYFTWLNLAMTIDRRLLKA